MDLALERLRAACSTLADSACVSVRVGDVLDLLFFADDHARCEEDLCEAVAAREKELNDGFDAEIEDLKGKHDEAIESLRAELQGTIESLRAELQGTIDNLEAELRAAAELVS